MASRSGGLAAIDRLAAGSLRGAAAPRRLVGLVCDRGEDRTERPRRARVDLCGRMGPMTAYLRYVVVVRPSSGLPSRRGPPWHTPGTLAASKRHQVTRRATPKCLSYLVESRGEWCTAPIRNQ